MVRVKVSPLVMEGVEIVQSSSNGVSSPPNWVVVVGMGVGVEVGTGATAVAAKAPRFTTGSWGWSARCRRLLQRKR